MVGDLGLVHSKLWKVFALSLCARLFAFVQFLLVSTLPQTADIGCYCWMSYWREYASSPSWGCDYTSIRANLSVVNWGLRVQSLKSVSCSAALRCMSLKSFCCTYYNLDANPVKHKRAHSVSQPHDTTSYNHTANILFPDQHNALSPPQLFPALSHNRAHASSSVFASRC